MNWPHIGIEDGIFAAALVLLVFVAGRVMYGYWPWSPKHRNHRRITRDELRAYAMRQLVGAAHQEADAKFGPNFTPNFQVKHPVVMSEADALEVIKRGGQPPDENSFDRPYYEGNDNDEPKDETKAEQKNAGAGKTTGEEH